MITPEKDVENLRNALLSKNADNIINIISKRTYSQRNILINKYKTTYNKDLVKEINDCLSYDNDLTELTSLLFLDPITFDCQTLYSSFNQGIKGISTIIEIISTRPSDILKKIMSTYSTLYKNKTIVNDIEKLKLSENGEIIRNILVSFLQKEKNENNSPDLEICQNLALKLKNEQIKKWFNVNSVLYQIIINKSQIEIKYISEYYKKLVGYGIIETIIKEINEDEKFYLIDIIYAISSPNKYFAEKINKAIKDKNENIISRIIITRKEYDLEQIKESYFHLYNNTLINDLRQIFSGDYFKLLSNMVGI